MQLSDNVRCLSIISCMLVSAVSEVFVPSSFIIPFDGPLHVPVYSFVPMGGNATFNCSLDFPYGIRIPYILSLIKNGTKILIRYEDGEMHAVDYADRVFYHEDIEYSHGIVNLINIQENDIGWYECSVLFPNRSPSTRNNGTWFHLDIEGSEGFSTSSSGSSGGGSSSSTVAIEETTSTEYVTELQTDSLGIIGPPEDLSIHLTTNGYLLSWSPPKQGVSRLRVYVVRLFKGPDKYLVSATETEHNTFLISDLEENEIYHFEVGTLSMNDFGAPSNMISIHVPAYGKITMAVAGVGCILLFAIVGGIVWYSRARYKAKPKSEINNVKSKPTAVENA